MEEDTCSPGIIFERENLRIRDTYHGTMAYFVNDAFIGKCLDLYGVWSYEEYLKTIPYALRTVVDVGANIGTHTLVYSEYTDRIISFEPQQAIFNLLCTNLTLNFKHHILTERCALSNYNGYTHIEDLDLENCGNYGSSSVGLGISNNSVRCRTLDSYHLEDVSLIKIDVEGHEMEVLEGSLKTISRCKPTIYVENDRTGKEQDLCDFIESLGYSYEWHVVPLFSEDNYRACDKNYFPGIASFNMLCLPRGEK